MLYDTTFFHRKDIEEYDRWEDPVDLTFDMIVQHLRSVVLFYTCDGIYDYYQPYEIS